MANTPPINPTVVLAQRLHEVAEQLRAWGHAHHKQVADETLLDEFRRLDAAVHRLAAHFGILVPLPVTKFPCEGFTCLQMYGSNITYAQGGRRIVLDPGWDGRLKAIAIEAQAIIELAAARPEGAGETRSAEEWLPATEAVERTERAGHPITLAWLSKYAEKHDVKTRPRQLRGNHKLEVEWNSLAGCLLRRQAAEMNADELPDAEKKDIEARKRSAAEQKRLGRSSH